MYHWARILHIVVCVIEAMKYILFSASQYSWEIGKASDIFVFTGSTSLTNQISFQSVGISRIVGAWAPVDVLFSGKTW
jgi:hypothetical protein